MGEGVYNIYISGPKSDSSLIIATGILPSTKLLFYPTNPYKERIFSLPWFIRYDQERSAKSAQFKKLYNFLFLCIICLKRPLPFHQAVLHTNLFLAIFANLFPTKNCTPNNPLHLGVKHFFYKKIPRNTNQVLAKVAGPQNPLDFFFCVWQGESYFFRICSFRHLANKQGNFRSWQFFFVIWLKNEFFVKWQIFFRQKAAPPLKYK